MSTSSSSRSTRHRGNAHANPSPAQREPLIAGQCSSRPWAQAEAHAGPERRYEHVRRRTERDVVAVADKCLGPQRELELLLAQMRRRGMSHLSVQLDAESIEQAIDRLEKSVEGRDRQNEVEISQLRREYAEKLEAQSVVADLMMRRHIDAMKQARRLTSHLKPSSMPLNPFIYPHPPCHMELDRRRRDPSQAGDEDLEKELELKRAASAVTGISVATYAEKRYTRERITDEGVVAAGDGQGGVL